MKKTIVWISAAGWLSIASLFILASMTLLSCSSSNGTDDEGGADAETEAQSEADEAAETTDVRETAENSEAEENAEAEEAVKDELVGAFQVLLVAPVAATATKPAEDGYAVFAGKVYDGPTPANVVWEQKLEEGSCKLLTPRVPFCSVSCGAGVCVEDDSCQNYPTAQSVGTLTVKGLKTASGADEFTLNPIANGYQSPTLPYQAFEEGGEISVNAAGAGSVGAFALTVKGIALLELTGGALKLQNDSPLTVSWKAPSVADVGKIYVKLDISHHGGSKGKIECVADDSGSLVIAAPLINRLLALGASGFPTIVVDRKSLAAAKISYGNVQLSVISEVETEVEVPGIISCNDDTDCPNGQTCQKDLKCQ